VLICSLGSPGQKKDVPKAAFGKKKFSTILGGGAMKTIRYVGTFAFVIGLFTVVFVGVPWHVTVSDNPVIPWWLRIAVYSLLGGILVVLLTVALEQGVGKMPAPEPVAAESQSSLLLSSFWEVPGQKITESLGLVQGNTIYAIWLGKDLSALIRLILGGEVTEYTDMMARARKVSTNRMIAHAEEMGADAIINIRYMTTSVVGTAAELFAYGTAVKLNNPD
jgi:uncharacterized protein YbjQ (UPF0145 family)